ncbi:hypothetical protein PMAYCL1PPCAC_01056 [Pristionchus mayeri]|uniref:C2H2-type domain-containing protein n=1 Tax=Pristionchus mayeri TaxID=1317129 RepID=A0AAN5C713_9BILA|nr:hypothetical protein PMAYCL1PPCAC_01056 [Pristionchus mayeri]
MTANTEALEFIKHARRKACTLYESDQIASPLIKTIALVERVVKGEAKDSALEGDVRRLLDEADYSREQDENRDDALRSLVIDVCKMVALSARVISSSNVLTANDISQSESTERADMVIPKEEPIHDLFTPQLSSREAAAYPVNSDAKYQPGQGRMPEQQNTLFSCSPSFTGGLAGDLDGIVKTEMDDWTTDTSFLDPIDNGETMHATRSSTLKRYHDSEAGPSTDSKRAKRSSTMDRSYAEDEAEEENNDDDKDYGHSSAPKSTFMDVDASFDGRFHCTICENSYRTLRGLQTYAFAHNTEKQVKLATQGGFPCTKCPKTFHSLRGLQTHDYVHNKAKNCIACGALVKLDNMAKHMSEKHSYLAERTTMTDEQKKGMEGELKLENSAEFFCTTCFMQCRDQAHFNIHTRTHNIKFIFMATHMELRERDESPKWEWMRRTNVHTASRRSSPLSNAIDTFDKFTRGNRTNAALATCSFRSYTTWFPICERTTTVHSWSMIEWSYSELMIHNRNDSEIETTVTGGQIVVFLYRTINFISTCIVLANHRVLMEYD